ncbi:MAG: hypothetical protein WBW36_07025, partial [Candidatus Sulfotelmatobacter sp.]
WHPARRLAIAALRVPTQALQGPVARTEAPSVIIFRLRNQTPAAVNPRLFRVIGDCESALASGAIIVVEDEGYRVRRLPIRR